MHSSGLFWLVGDGGAVRRRDLVPQQISFFSSLRAMCACRPASDIAGSAPASCGPGSEVSAAWGVGCKTVRATTMAATSRPAAIQNARWYPNMFTPRGAQHRAGPQLDDRHDRGLGRACGPGLACLLYTSDAADDLLCV